jgi:hypothetical protein
MLKNSFVIGVAIVFSINVFASQERCKIMGTAAGILGITVFGHMTRLAFQRELPFLRNLPYRPEYPVAGSIAGTITVVSFVYTVNNIRKCALLVKDRSKKTH